MEPAPVHAETNNPLVTSAGKDLANGRFDRVLTRFAPEPNAFIHLGSAISCAMTFGLAEELGGSYNLRFDDTNPESAKEEYADSIKADLRWLGYDWASECYASDYFERLFEWAKALICNGKAYVCDLGETEMSKLRGTGSFDSNGNRLTPPGVDSPYRARSVDENLGLFQRMKNGEFADGSRTLRAKIDMSHDNLLMRDPVMYRVKHTRHHRTGDAWCIYPTYDWAHGQSDSIEGITHSICGLEFRSHRPLYDWFLDQLGVHHPRQMEYTRINLTYTVTGKRYLKRLVSDAIVDGWDDPRLPTLSALRRRGFPPEVIRSFCEGLSISDRKITSTIDIELFEHVARAHLNKIARRYMAVLRPLKVVLENYSDDLEEKLVAVNNPEDPESGTRDVPFSREIFIDRDDFMEYPVKKFYRLAPGREVRLRYAYFITCTRVIKDNGGRITELRCTYDPDTRGGDAPDGRKVKSTLHWVSARRACRIEARIYDRLFRQPEPLKNKADDRWMESVNRDSVEVVDGCLAEPALLDLDSGATCQFERVGYFCAEQPAGRDYPVFHQTVALRDEWRKVREKQNI